MRPSHVRKILSGITLTEDVFLRSGFRVADAYLRGHLERIGCAVLHGFHESTANVTFPDLNRIAAVSDEFEGFAWAGTSMGLTMLDAFFPQRPTRLQRLISGAAPHRFMIYFGAGWAVADLRFARLEAAFIPNEDELLQWVPLLGYGVHQAYFHWGRYVENRLVEASLYPREGRIFDEGIGCALWLGEGASVERACARIAEFPQRRQMDLWTGLGFGCTYAGVAGMTSLQYLREASGPFHAYLAEGAAIAARARRAGGIPTSYTDLACQQLCNAVDVTTSITANDPLRSFSADRTIPVYEGWWRRILRF